MLQRIGFFHYGSADKAAPSDSLRASLKDASAGDLRDSLIVLPEAFNIVGEYHCTTSKRGPSIARDLREISREFNIAIVAGLVDEDCGEMPGCSSAYLIDGRICKLLSHKNEDDGSHKYKPCGTDCDTPLLHRGICVAALICMDADKSDLRLQERHRAMLRGICGVDAPRAVLCVPAHMTTIESKQLAEQWSININIVVSNSGVSKPSVIRLAGNPQSICHAGSDNRVCVKDLI